MTFQKYQLVTDGAKYSPKIGFTLDIHKFNSTNLYSHYHRVIGEEDESDVVNVIVQSGMQNWGNERFSDITSTV